VIAVIGLGLGVSVPAWADPRDDARRHFAAGLEAVAQTHYDVAISEFLAAQASYPLPQTLYNIGRSYADAGDFPNALKYFKQFREADPAHVAFIDPIIADFEQRVAASSAPVASAEPAPSGPGIVTAEDATRFDEIINQLRSLTDSLDQKRHELASSTPAPAPTNPAPGATVTPQPAGSSGGDASADFLQDAYRRVVVTASRVGQDPLDSPSTVTIITADDIRDSGALDVPDLLRRVVGVEVMASSGGHSDVSIRALGRKMNNTVLFLLDGRPLYMEATGWMFWTRVQIELEEIERIEVIRGPGSAVYGADAVTGVVNIITKTPGDGPSVITGTTGTTDIRRVAAVASGRVGTTGYRMSAGYQQQGAFSKEAEFGSPDTSPVRSPLIDPNLGMEAIRMNARADKSFGDKGAISLSGGLSESTEEFISLGTLQNEVWQFRTRYARGDGFVGPVHIRSSWTNDNGKLGNALQYVGERGVDANYVTDVVDTEVEVPEKIVTGPVTHQFDIGAGWRFDTTRMTWLKGGFNQLYSESRYSVFANEQATVGRLSAVGSLRVDRHPLIDISHTISPRLAILWRLFEKTSLRLTTGTAFRNPGYGETDFGLRIPTPSDGIYVQGVPNHDLLPERIVTYELGIHDESSYYHRVDVVAFHNTISNLIYTADVPPVIQAYNGDANGYPVGIDPFTNLDYVLNQYGVEADLELYPIDGLDLFANGSASRDFASDSTTNWIDKSTGELKFNVGGTYRSPFRTDFSLWLNWISAETWPLRDIDPSTLSIVVTDAPLPARTLLEARVAARPFKNQPIELALTGWNLTELFGDGYREHPQGQLVPARVYGTASWQF